ncbi:DadA Glycine/D-amino acid oxidases (deaminating) [Caulobacteraceae bacterium]
MNVSDRTSDVIVVGMGIVGLAHALAAARLGKSVTIIDRQPHAVGASVRNFGFVTITGQERGDFWGLALRARDIWAEVAEAAQIPILHRGLAMVAKRAEASDVLEAFMATEMGEGCELLSGEAFKRSHSTLDLNPFESVLVSPHEVRVEPRTALSAIAFWLKSAFGVRFETLTSVHAIEGGKVTTSRGVFQSEIVFVCPGDDLSTLYPDVMAQRGVTRCTLQMLRLAAPGYQLPHAFMSDLGLLRYRGYSQLPGIDALAERLQAEQSAHLAAGIHLIAVQSGDGSLVVGDSHVYGQAENPFATIDFENLILDEFASVFAGKVPPVIERWVGTYASSGDQQWFVETPEPEVRLSVVTSGAGMSTAFAIGERVVREVFQ